LYPNEVGASGVKKEMEDARDAWHDRTSRTWIRKKVYILGTWSKSPRGCTCYDANATVDIGYDNAGATALDLHQEIEPILTSNVWSKELKPLQAQLNGMKVDCLPPPPPIRNPTSFTASDCSVGKSYVMTGCAQPGAAADSSADSFVSTTCSGATPICYVDWQTTKHADTADPYAKDGPGRSCTKEKKTASCKSAEEAKAACAKFKERTAEAEEKYTALCMRLKCHLPYCVDQKAYERMSKRMETSGEQETCKEPQYKGLGYNGKPSAGSSGEFIWRSYEEICADCEFKKFSCNEEGGLDGDGDISGALSTSLSAVAFVLALVAALQ